MLRVGLTATIFILVMGLALFAQSPFRSSEDAYRFGYQEGFRHGSADSSMGLRFNYTHPHRFQSGITYHSYENTAFRSGYMAGYRDGYGMQDVDVDFDDFDDDDRLRIVGSTSGFVSVFTNDNFDGTIRALNIGHYPDLDGRLEKSIDSIEIHGAVRVILFSEPNFRGDQLILEQSVSDLDDFNFGDRAESMIVERQ